MGEPDFSEQRSGRVKKKSRAEQSPERMRGEGRVFHLGGWCFWETDAVVSVKGARAVFNFPVTEIRNGSEMNASMQTLVGPSVKLTSLCQIKESRRIVLLSTVAGLFYFRFKHFV
jgi:hypothetical protein